ncbi:hypothetical protein [Algoriphagus persicinus]|nr:hypothetical protein [Algoriphagus sp. E1-3-M2]MEB2783594.1 hypothetical protein [Algoriphagus sp. E1-3-M2]
MRILKSSEKLTLAMPGDFGDLGDLNEQNKTTLPFLNSINAQEP